MACGPPSAHLILTPEERAALTRFVRPPTTAQALALRARIVLACWFSILPWRERARGVHRSMDALEQALRHHIPATNAHPKSFVWTKTADEILESIAHFYHRTSRSRHQSLLTFELTEGRHFVRNPASGRVLQKVGMRLEGLHCGAFLRWGNFEDVAVCAVLESEWDAGQSHVEAPVT
ncbi:MAG TPA: GNAT family protein [Gemmatimonadaceae bacterium]|nr:GNAT family protein [Gemmatimonadaceae bacterium]